jgi:hypothetical protein
VAIAGCQVGGSVGGIVRGLSAAGRVDERVYNGKRRSNDGKRAFEEEPQSPNSRDSALLVLADSLSLFCLAWQLRSFSTFSQSVVFLARIPRLRRSLGAYLEFVLSSFSELDPCFQ